MRIYEEAVVSVPIRSPDRIRAVPETPEALADVAGNSDRVWAGPHRSGEETHQGRAGSSPGAPG